MRDAGVRVPGELFSDGERLVGVPELTGMRLVDAVTTVGGYARSCHRGGGS